jgi:hypothetical protein
MFKDKIQTLINDRLPKGDLNMAFYLKILVFTIVKEKYMNELIKKKKSIY